MKLKLIDLQGNEVVKKGDDVIGSLKCILHGVNSGFFIWMSPFTKSIIVSCSRTSTDHIRTNGLAKAYLDGALVFEKVSETKEIWIDEDRIREAINDNITIMPEEGEENVFIKLERPVWPTNHSVVSCSKRDYLKDTSYMSSGDTLYYSNNTTNSGIVRYSDSELSSSFVPFVKVVNVTSQSGEVIYTSPSLEAAEKEDRVNHPSHYTWLKDKCGIEVIDITKHLDNNLGNVVKYVLRSGKKSEEGMSATEKTVEDLKKAKFYLEVAIQLEEEKLNKSNK